MKLTADARRLPLADRSVQMCVTSPPYWGLRMYVQGGDAAAHRAADGKTTPHVWRWQSDSADVCEVCGAVHPVSVWGGRPGCEHDWETDEIVQEMRAGIGLAEFSKQYRGGGKKQAEVGVVSALRGTCLKCGAWRGAYGLEPTVEMYVEHTVEMLREIRRVLRDDGVCFWNIGDSYYNGDKNGAWNRSDKKAKVRSNFPGAGNRLPQPGLKPKDLCLIPMRVALAAQADGWWVRCWIVWWKDNPMTESVTDRPTDAYEYILMLTKRARYYWDAEAVKEAQSVRTPKLKAAGAEGTLQRFAPGQAPRKPGPKANGRGGRNLRNVWTFPTQPYSGAHFATFPEEFPRRCIRAATSAKGACAQCEKPWERVVRLSRNGDVEPGNPQLGPEVERNSQTIGWRPGCDCYEASCPSCGVVLGYNWHEEPRTRQTPEGRKEEVSVVQTSLLRPDGSLQVVQPEVQSNLGSQESQDNYRPNENHEGLHHAVSPQPPIGEAGRICDGAPHRDGEDFGPLFEGWRDCSPSERAEGRQQAGEPRSDAEARSRQDAEAEANQDSGLSTLPEDDIPLGVCRNCKCPLEFTGPEVIPQTVLDPFAGSGTTGRVAMELGRRAVLVDIAYAHPEGYAGLAARRTSGVQPILPF